MVLVGEFRLVIVALPLITLQVPVPVTAAVAAIVKLAQENETLMDAAKVGVISAKARIKDIINRQRNIGVYAENGERPFVPDAGVTRRKLA